MNEPKRVFTVTFDRVGRWRNVTLTISGRDFDELVDDLYGQVKPFLASECVDVYIDADALTAHIFVGMVRPAGDAHLVEVTS